MCRDPPTLSILARAYGKLGKFDNAWRCIDGAMSAVETTKGRWCEAEVNRTAGEIALTRARHTDILKQLIVNLPKQINLKIVDLEGIGVLGEATVAD